MQKRPISHENIFLFVVGIENTNGNGKFWTALMLIKNLKKKWQIKNF